MKGPNKFNQQKRRENESEGKFAENFPEYIKDTNPRIQKAQQTPGRISKKRRQEGRKKEREGGKKEEGGRKGGRKEGKGREGEREGRREVI